MVLMNTLPCRACDHSCATQKTTRRVGGNRTLRRREPRRLLPAELALATVKCPEEAAQTQYPTVMHLTQLQVWHTAGRLLPKGMLHRKHNPRTALGYMLRHRLQPHNHNLQRTFSSIIKVSLTSV